MRPCPAEEACPLWPCLRIDLAAGGGRREYVLRLAKTRARGLWVEGAGWAEWKSAGACECMYQPQKLYQ